MRDLALQTAGVLAILVSIGHGVVGELGVFARAQIEPPRTRTLLRGIWQATTLSWIGLGVLLIAAPTFGSQTARRWVIAVAIVVYAYAAVGNAMATRGRHIGWGVMTAVIVLALIGR